MNTSRSRWATRVTHSPHHHGSHRDLLCTVTPAAHRSAAVDAIVVPTARPPQYLHTAIGLAAGLECTLVTLCSDAAATAAATALARPTGIDFMAVDVSALPGGLMPGFETERLLTGLGLGRSTDLGLKRNVGMLISRLMGWGRIIFLDDDISVPDSRDIRSAVGLLDRYAGVGLSIDDYPNNSAVCHAYRMVGGEQDTFVGAGALAVCPATTTSFFPNIYNEDWFFLLGEDRLLPVATTGEAHQQSYDPFESEEQAEFQEFGECLAEGVFWLLDHGHTITAADADYWDESIQRRRLFIEHVLGRIGGLDTDDVLKQRMEAVLTAARERNQHIGVDLCVDYLAAWRRDRLRWQRHLSTLDRQHRGGQARASGVDPAQLLDALGLAGCSVHLPQANLYPLVRVGGR